jgi:uncharacterized membrane protein
MNAPPFGDRVDDRVTAGDGRWTLIFLTIVAIAAWMLIDTVLAKASDAYPYILLSLMLACLAVLQAPLIMPDRSRAATATHSYADNRSGAWTRASYRQ